MESRSRAPPPARALHPLPKSDPASAPPPLAAAGRVCPAPGRRERTGAGAGAAGGVARLRARAEPTCGPRSARSGSAPLLSVPTRRAMGSGWAADSVRARYLVYFQYLGTDFKYVLRTPPVPAAPPPHDPAPREAPELDTDGCRRPSAGGEGGSHV